MKTSTVNTNVSTTYSSYDVPGNGLTITVEINAKTIRIIPGIASNAENVKGTSFTKRHTVTYYEFPVDEYKEFWNEFKKSSEAEDDDMYARMRKAMTYALHKYQIRYGKIFA